MIRLLPLLCALLVSILAVSPTRAEVSELKIARQFGLTYMPLMVLEDQKSIEKHAKAAGIDLKVSYIQLASSAAMSDALLSGSAHIVSGGVQNQLVLWEKTKGGVLGFGGLAVYDSYLLCTDPDVKGIRDLSDKHRIAVPAAKISPQAIQLQMAAAREWGIENYAKLDTLTVSRAHPDSVAALLSRGTEVNCYVSNPPYTERLLRDRSINKVASMTSLMGIEQETRGVTYATVKFAKDNPKVTAAFTKALAEAYAFLQADPRRAAETYLRVSGDKESLETILEIITKPDFKWTPIPHGVMRSAEFMHKVGMMKTVPKSLGEVFMPGTNVDGGS